MFYEVTVWLLCARVVYKPWNATEKGIGLATGWAFTLEWRRNRILSYFLSKFYLQRHITRPLINSKLVRECYPEIIKSTQLWGWGAAIHGSQPTSLLKFVHTCTPGVHALAHAHREALTQPMQDLPGHMCVPGLLLWGLWIPTCSRATSGAGNQRTGRREAFLGQALG